MAYNNSLALLMAAGQSRRFGSDDKRLAKLGSKSLLSASLGRVQASYASLVLVLKEGDQQRLLDLADGVLGPNSHCFYCANPERGLGANIAQAMRWILSQPQYSTTESVALLLADMPFILPSTLNALQALAMQDNIVRPKWRDQPGHPVAFGRKYWPELAVLEGDRGAASVLARHHDQVCWLEVDDEGVCFDIDTQPALDQARARSGA